MKTSVFHIIDYGILQNPVKTDKNDEFNCIVLVKLLELQLTSYLNFKPANCIFINNQLTIRLFGFVSQLYSVAI